MAKIPYLVRRKNIFYFRLRVPADLQEILKVREITQSLKTESRGVAIPLALRMAASISIKLQELKSGNSSTHLQILKQANEDHQNNVVSEPAINYATPAPAKSSAHLLSFVIEDFLKRYDPANKSMLIKLNATLPILIELVGDKPIDQIYQTDINSFFDEVQMLPVRRDAAKFKGLSIKQVIVANTGGACIAEKTFTGTYRACVNVFVQWAITHYKDQGFPSLSTGGCSYRGSRAEGINKQRAMKPEELERLFSHPKMKEYAASADTAHYCWLPLIGLFTGARINEVCQLNPFTDIVQDDETGVYYFHLTDEGETAEGVNKSIKTNSSRRVVPIHSKLLDLGLLDYVERVKADNRKIIFPQWQPRGGKASANAGKWFTRFVEDVGIKDATEGARLSGFHSFRHTFITWGMSNKIHGIFDITGHETESVDGFGKISAVAKGYWTRGIADNILEKQTTIEQFDYGLSFYRPTL
jgi:hypothetical protein